MSAITVLISQTLSQEKLPSWSAKPTPLGYVLKRQKLPAYQEFDYFYRTLSKKHQGILHEPFWDILFIIAELGCLDAVNGRPQAKSVAQVLKSAKPHQDAYDTFKRASSAVKYSLSEKQQKPLYFKTWGLMQATYEFAYGLALDQKHQQTG